MKENDQKMMNINFRMDNHRQRDIGGSSETTNGSIINHNNQNYPHHQHLLDEETQNSLLSAVAATSS